MGMNVLEIKGLSKSFGDKKVLDRLDLTIPEHSIYGFIGMNGAGKTTTMKSVVGLLKPDEGEIYICGEKVTFGETRTNRNIGYLPDVPEFYGFMTAREYLKLCSDISGMNKDEAEKRISEMLTLVGLAQEKHRIGGYSRGMKQRLGIAQALLCRPKLLICDEPTSALDPVGRKEILDILKTAVSETTVLFSTHILTDVERVCTDAAFLHEGKIVLHGKIGDIMKSSSGREFSVELETKEDADKVISAFPCGVPESECVIHFSESNVKMSEMLSFLADNSISPERIERKESSLESRVLEVIGK